MLNTVIVYVARTGNARRIAERIAGRLHGKAFLIEDKVNRKGLWGYLRAGYHSSTKKATPIGDPGVDLSKADSVVMVQPIWASGIVPPLRTWLKAHEHELKGKKLGLFTVCKGSDAEPVRRAFEAEFMPLAAFGSIKELDGEKAQEEAFEAFALTLS
jgi:menaquinone-dependent protoporphyrinogen IX oxidase